MDGFACLNKSAYWRKENEFTESTYAISDIDTYNFSMRVAATLECPE